LAQFAQGDQRASVADDFHANSSWIVSSSMIGRKPCAMAY
jgi:hypothetical protein